MAVADDGHRGACLDLEGQVVETFNQRRRFGLLVTVETHDDLLAIGGTYAAMWARQQLAEALDE